jgi:hypothetical protein
MPISDATFGRLVDEVRQLRARFDVAEAIQRERDIQTAEYRRALKEDQQAVRNEIRAEIAAIRAKMNGHGGGNGGGVGPNKALVMLAGAAGAGVAAFVARLLGLP